jgi:hypothetical protein
VDWVNLMQGGSGHGNGDDDEAFQDSSKSLA